MLEIINNFTTNYPFIVLIIGFLMLIKGADMLVDGASSIAKKFGISSLVIGLTIVAFGTSAPELAVNVMSAMEGKTQMAIGNILGSNISNIFFILGATAIVYPIAIPKSTVKKEIPFMIFTSVILLLLLLDGNLSRIDAGILGVFFIGFLAYTWSISKQNVSNEDNEEIKIMGNFKAISFVIIGLIGLIFGGDLIVDSAKIMAKSFGWSDAFIGVTIIAIGTSLPELAASVSAALKKQTDMAIGGIVGSNIFNVLWILSATAFIKPLDGYTGMEIDLTIELIASILVFIFAFIFRKFFLQRIEGIILLLAYIGFLTYQAYNVGMFN